MRLREKGEEGGRLRKRERKRQRARVMELQEAGNKEEAKEFVIWKELAEGKEMVCSWSLCDVYLVNDSLYPGWLVLVPRVCGAREIFQLSTEQQIQLIQEISKASQVVKILFSPDKLNVGALGNVVAQLHIHIVPRFKSDIAWPGPMWGAHPGQPFPSEEFQNCLNKIKLHTM